MIGTATVRRMAERRLYLVRHGEADGHAEESALTARGVEQAVATGERLRAAGIETIHHSPLSRATHTATLIGERLGVEVRADQIVGDYIPSDPTGVTELPAAYAEFAAGFTEAERTHGPARATLALERFATPPDADVCELVVTHNFTIGGFVCAALGAPPWRWMSLNQANCGITIIRYRTGLPPALAAFNDVGHLTD